MKKLFLIVSLLPLLSWAQGVDALFPEEQNDINVGGDIFENFNDDLEASQVMEDERFYRYSRFFGINLGLGITTFTDNRGVAYSKGNNLTYNFSLLYFMDFQNAFVIGIAYSKHIMILDTSTLSSRTENIGIVESNMLRPYMGLRYYLDTSDLGTALTYSNPYIVGRVEYWFQKVNFIERPNLDDENQDGLGSSVGVGLEFPIELKKSYINVEFLYHYVNFKDKYTSDYAAIPTDELRDGEVASKYGYEDLRGEVLTVVVNYHFSY